MSFTAAEVITTRVTPLMTRQAVTLTAANLLVWLSDGLLALRSLRAGAFIDDEDNPIACETITGLADTIGLDRKWMGPLTDYVRWRAFQEDAQSGKHREDAMAAFESFVAQVKAL